MMVWNEFDYLPTKENSMILRNKRSQLLWTIVFLLPAMLIYVTLMLSPLIQSVYMSFFSWTGIAGSPMKYVGFNNYVRVFSGHRFWESLINVGWFMAEGLSFLMPLSFVLAHLITKKSRASHFYKTAFFFPALLPITAIGLIWTYILYPDGGLVPDIMQKLGLPAINFLGNPDIAIISVVLINEWIFAGLNMIIFAAGLVSIPNELYEAAVIDGAGGWQRLRYITLPLMKESFKIFSILCVTGCIRHFDLVFVMTGGGPAHATEVPATLLYNEAFKYRNFGTGNAIGVFILMAGLLLSYLMIKLFDRKE